MADEKIIPYFRGVEDLGASDIHFKADEVPMVRISSGFRKMNTQPTSEAFLQEMFGQTYGNRKEQIQQNYEKYGSADFSWSTTINGNLLRYRIQIFRSTGQMAAAIRRISADIPSFEQLNLPKIYGEILEIRKSGIVIVGGETGSGKSTTLASMLKYMGDKYEKNIVTIEDPIEVVIEAKKSRVNQREMGGDFTDFQMALKAVVREDPDIILVGEMRDVDTVRSAITAAETGHLVLTTLHTANAPGTIDRIINFFPQVEEQAVRNNLSNNLIGVMNQMLLPTIDGKARVPATEVMINNPSVRRYIKDREQTSGLGDLIEASKEGMHNFNQSLIALVKTERIHIDVAKHATSNVDHLMALFKDIGSR